MGTIKPDTILRFYSCRDGGAQRLGKCALQFRQRRKIKLGPLARFKEKYAVAVNAGGVGQHFERRRHIACSGNEHYLVARDDRRRAIVAHEVKQQAAIAAHITDMGRVGGNDDVGGRIARGEHFLAHFFGDRPQIVSDKHTFISPWPPLAGA